MTLGQSVPRFVDYATLRDDPISFLRSVRHSVGEVALILEDRPLFSRAPRCAGTVAAFGPAAVQRVLTDTETFGMPVSVAQRFGLPPRLVRLNSGLFSMHGERHRAHQQILMRLLGQSSVLDYGTAIAYGWKCFNEELATDREVSLPDEMRRLVANISGRMIFGSGGLGLSKLIQAYFDDRRNFARQERNRDFREGSEREARRGVVRTGLRIDGMLRVILEEFKRGAAESGEPRCIFAKLAELKNRGGPPLTDDQMVAHANVLFMSSSEPLAVALTWTLLLLSQHPEVLAAARREVTSAFAGSPPPDRFSDKELPVVRSVVLESLRLLPPNAIMVRLTSRDGELLGHRLPKFCEVLLSPYVAHRDASEFAEPDRFKPSRWPGLNPSPYTYFPFGAGIRYCLGKYMASFVLVSILARIIREYDVPLTADQTIDWKMHITLMPVGGPLVRFVPRSAPESDWGAGRLKGPVADLIHGRASGTGDSSYRSSIRIDGPPLEW